uniref:Neurotransmitter-gated ion-channel ligand-binding domain-containing protein n=1 Tax=Romanomermis culicivorax TaxID=13658 RepID=A0A915K7J5_ROMCU
MIFYVSIKKTFSDENEENVKHNEFITKNQEKLLSSLFASYSNRVRPCGSELNSDKDLSDHVIEDHEKPQNSCGPTRVKVHVYLRSVDEIDDKAMNFDMQLIFRQTWKDHRLSYKNLLSPDYQPSYISLAPGEQQFKIWAPDTFFVNEKEGYRHEIDKDNVMIRIDPDGKVIYTFR